MKRALTLAVLTLAACAHTRTAEAKHGGAEVADYYPLAVGNTWTYQVTALGAPPQTDEIAITKEDKGRFTDSKGNVLQVDSYGIRDERRYLLRGPVEVGTKWNNVVSVSSYEQYRIVEAGTSCEAPAGTFQGCVVVESRNESGGGKALIATLTFAPKVGLIRVATELEADGKRIPQVKLELTKYQVAQPAAPAPRVGS